MLPPCAQRYGERLARVCELAELTRRAKGHGSRQRASSVIGPWYPGHDLGLKVTSYATEARVITYVVSRFDSTALEAKIVAMQQING